EEALTAFSFGCLLPFHQMVIRPDGKVSLCCNDALGKMTLGDLTQESIENIWHSQEYVTVRAKLTQGRQHLELCKHCDSRL
ncbi:MAG: SPASM domain-containing protein, partial [Sporomusaceae bacterium]|nr:SPASM domain-containing protein [Sporomusaceae bacterium]